LNWAGIFLGAALIAGVVGFSGADGGAATVARVSFGLLLVLFLVAVLWGKPVA
jgi:uncharacterized membrane protein YtjA (UPF0391 family)